MEKLRMMFSGEFIRKMMKPLQSGVDDNRLLLPIGKKEWDQMTPLFPIIN